MVDMVDVEIIFACLILLFGLVLRGPCSCPSCILVPFPIRVLCYVGSSSLLQPLYIYYIYILLSVSCI